MPGPGRPKPDPLYQSQALGGLSVALESPRWTLGGLMQAHEDNVFCFFLQKLNRMTYGHMDGQMDRPT